MAKKLKNLEWIPVRLTDNGDWRHRFILRLRRHFKR